MLIVVAVIGGNVKSRKRRGMRRMRRKDIATNNIEVLQLRQKLVTRIDWQIPDMPVQSYGFQATQISNSNLILCGGINNYTTSLYNYEYFILEKGERKWSSAGSMLKPKAFHSSVFMNGSIFSCGGIEPLGIISHGCHEEFRLEDKIVRERKKLPIKLQYHSATEIDQNRYMVVGGIGQVGVGKMQKLKLE